MGKRRLSKSDIKTLDARVASLGIGFAKRDAVEILDDGGITYFVGGVPWLFEHEGALVPRLKLLQERMVLPKVTVDMGAIKAVTSGADVMRPGIVAIDEGIAEGALVAVVDELHGKPLAVGRALMGSAAMRAATAGKAVAVLHHVGDKRWDI